MSFLLYAHHVHLLREIYVFSSVPRPKLRGHIYTQHMTYFE